MSTHTVVKKKAQKRPIIKRPSSIFLRLVNFSLALKGLTLESLANQHGVVRASLNQAFYRPCPKAERTIAEAIGKKPWDLWPDRYDENGKPNRRNAWYDRGRRSSSKRTTEKTPLVNGNYQPEINHEKNDQSGPDVSFRLPNPEGS